MLHSMLQQLGGLLFSSNWSVLKLCGCAPTSRVIELLFQVLLFRSVITPSMISSKYYYYNTWQETRCQTSRRFYQLPLSQSFHSSRVSALKGPCILSTLNMLATSPHAVLQELVSGPCPPVSAGPAARPATAAAYASAKTGQDQRGTRLHASVACSENVVCPNSLIAGLRHSNQPTCLQCASTGGSVSLCCTTSNGCLGASCRACVSCSSCALV